MKSHEIDYRIYGDDLQAVEITLDPHETVIAEAGAMNWLEDGINFETRMGDGSQPNQGMMSKLLNVGKRLLTGESIFMTHFTNLGTGRSNVAFAAPYPGKIIPVDLSQVGGRIICQKDSFLCAAYGTEVTIAFNKRLGAGFFGGEGFILQQLRGDGLAFAQCADQYEILGHCSTDALEKRQAEVGGGVVFAVGLAVAAMEKFPVLFTDGLTLEPVKLDTGITHLAPFLTYFFALVVTEL